MTRETVAKLLLDMESDRIERSNAKTFDEQPCTRSNLTDLNINAFKVIYLPTAIDSETLAANHREPQDQLSSLGLYDLQYDCCTHAGVLLLAENPRVFIPGAYIQYVRFSGKEMDVSAVEAEKEFSGPLVTLLGQVADFVNVVLIKERTIAGNTFQQTKLKNYPLWALRELVMNAIMHRNYESNAPIYIYEFSNRVEILNPGGLYGEVNPHNFPGASDYRNPIIATAMKHLNFVNRFNFGVINAQASLAKNGNPPPEFDLSLQTKFKATVYAHEQWAT